MLESSGGTPVLQTPTGEPSSTPLDPGLPVPDAPADVSRPESRTVQPPSNDKHQKNFETIKYSIAHMLRTAATLLQTFGKASLSKRNPDPFQKHSQTLIAESLAQTVIDQLSAIRNSPMERTPDAYGYWTGVLKIVEDLLVDCKYL